MRSFLWALLLVVGCPKPATTNTTNTTPVSVPSTEGKTPAEYLELIQKAVVDGNCQSGLGMISEYDKAYGGPTSDTYWYKGYCHRDTNPEAACQAYGNFIKLASADARAEQAKQYISAQDQATHPACVLP